MRRHSPRPHPTVCEHIHGGGAWGGGGLGGMVTKDCANSAPIFKADRCPHPQHADARTPQSLTLSEGPPWPFSKTSPALVLWELPPHLGGAGRSVLCPGWRTQQPGCCFQGQNVRPDSHPRAPGQAGAPGVTSPPRGASRPCPKPRFLTGPPGASGIKLVHGNPASVSASREPSLKPSFVPAVAMAPRRRRVLCSPEVSAPRETFQTIQCVIRVALRPSVRKCSGCSEKR